MVRTGMFSSEVLGCSVSAQRSSSGSQMLDVVELHAGQGLVYDALRDPALEVGVQDPLEEAELRLPKDWADEEAAWPVLSPDLAWEGRDTRVTH